MLNKDKTHRRIIHKYMDIGDYIKTCTFFMGGHYASYGINNENDGFIINEGTGTVTITEWLLCDIRKFIPLSDYTLRKHIQSWVKKNVVTLL